MHTVLRFMSDQVKVATLESIGLELNTLVPGAFDGLRRQLDGFASDVSEAEDWEEHRAELLRYVDLVRPVLAKARAEQVSVWLDIAVDRSDITGRNMTCFPMSPEMTGALGYLGLGLEFTIYFPDPDGS